MPETLALSSRPCRLAIIVATAWVVTSFAAAGKDLGSLPRSATPRFALTDRVWPEAVDRPHVCLWKDDALAAVSITIDDNTAPDHAWWTAEGQKHGILVTWFIITSLISDERPGYHGDWDSFRRLHGEGHDIQSHTVTHVSPRRGFDPDDPTKDLHHEYGRSRDIIEARIPGQRVLTLAFPGGSYQREHTDLALAAEYYIAARGGVGQINPANQIDYRQTSSIGNGLYLDDAQHARTSLLNLIDRRHAYRPNQYRGWYVAHFHRVAEHDKPRLAKAMAWLDAHKADVWTGLFREVAQYGQERDTARLSVLSAGKDAIRLTLADDMDDTRFDFPLTIKLRLPDSWDTCSATQAGRPVPIRIVEHGGSRFALVAVVPDRGDVAVRAR